MTSSGWQVGSARRNLLLLQDGAMTWGTTSHHVENIRCVKGQEEGGREKRCTSVFCPFFGHVPIDSRTSRGRPYVSVCRLGSKFSGGKATRIRFVSSVRAHARAHAAQWLRPLKLDSWIALRGNLLCWLLDPGVLNRSFLSFEKNEKMSELFEILDNSFRYLAISSFFFFWIVIFKKFKLYYISNSCTFSCRVS